MGAAAVALVALLVFGWGLFSARLARADLTAPIVFVVAGVLLSEGFRVIEPETTHGVLKVLAEVTLVWVLFADAARVRLRQLRADAGLYARLLGLGLPLTVAAGALLAGAMFGGIGFWAALLIGAALAPTDAALGAAVMSDPAVPGRVRRVLNVESGLNDGIVTPVVSFAIAGAAVAEGAPGLGGALSELLAGLAIGVALGAAGGGAMRTARRRGWASAEFAGPAVLALAVAAYTATVELEGNGFVAAFVAGMAFGNVAGRGGATEVFYVEQTAGLASLLTWLLFGAVVVPTVVQEADWRVLGYAVLSLTVIRMLPVALALARSGLSLRTVAFIGWFGPRGLASIIFAVLALEELGEAARPAVAVIGTTVLLSVFTHGLSAKTLATRYGASAAHPATHAADGTSPAHFPVRALVHRNPAATAPIGRRDDERPGQEPGRS
jgi:NhaP-type Na+/H+ or K+/H+ antiporter